MFPFLVWKVHFKYFWTFLETLKYLSSSVGKILRYLPRFLKELFQFQIYSRHHFICFIYRLIFQKHEQFLNIWTRQFFFNNSNVFPKNYLIKLRHFLHSLTDCSYLYLSIYFYIASSCKVLSTSFNRNIEPSFNCPMY